MQSNINCLLGWTGHHELETSNEIDQQVSKDNLTSDTNCY